MGTAGFSETVLYICHPTPNDSPEDTTFRNPFIKLIKHKKNLFDIDQQFMLLKQSVWTLNWYDKYVKLCTCNGSVVVKIVLKNI
jgi:hypothetical protein